MKSLNEFINKEKVGNSSDTPSKVVRKRSRIESEQMDKLSQTPVTKDTDLSGKVAFISPTILSPMYTKRYFVGFTL